MRSKKLSTILLVSMLGLSAWIVHGFLLPGQGPVLEEWETHNAKFKVRVQRRADLYGIMSYWYVFQSAQKDSTRWREITRHLYDEPDALPKKQIRFVTKDVGYLFFQLKYAVTVDSGNTWTVFDFGNNPSFKPEDLDYSRIADVEIQPEGTGKLTMFKYDITHGRSTLFFTYDYGQHWVLKR
jgi:hypothetical protein